MPQSKTKKFSKNILKNSVVLYLVFVAALINLLVFGYQRDWMSGAIFVLVAFLTTFFSKNMIVILCLAMVVANIYKYGSEVAVSEGTKEGFTEDVKAHADTDANADANASENSNNIDLVDSLSYLDHEKEKEDRTTEKDKKHIKEKVVSKSKFTPEVKEQLHQKFKETVKKSSHIPKEKKEQMVHKYEAMLTMAEQFSNMQPAIEQFKAEMSSLSA